MYFKMAALASFWAMKLWTWKSSFFSELKKLSVQPVW
jgi:hypothetical protein